MIAMTNYTNKVNRTAVRTPQNQKARPEQVENNAKGFVFEIDMWARLDRFVILGSEKNTYYVSSNELTNDNYESLIECINENGIRVVNRIVELSKSGRAPKNTPAVFALAVCGAFGDKITKEAAFRNMPAVARTATDFFGFIGDYKTLGGGFGVVARKGIEGWYQSKEISSAAYQIIKYRQRNGWTHLDALRLAHVKPRNNAENNLYSFAKSLAGKNSEYDETLLPKVAQGYLRAKNSSKASEIVELITDFSLPREAIPTEFLGDASVWEALLQNMPATAMIRNLGKMTSVGLINTNSDGAKLVEEKFADAEWLRKSRLHPVTILNALSVYNSGHGVRGSLTWSPARRVVDALDGAFYNAFQNVEPSGKRLMLALDTSGSMSTSYGNEIGFSLSPREITAAMSMATAYIEEDYTITYFSSGSSRHNWGHETTGIEELAISPRQRLDDVIKTISGLRWGGTDCALPMIWALKKGIEIDTFVIYTDNDTWAGGIHPFEALKQYRKETGIDAKLVVCATVPLGFSIADPSDAGMLDIVGFDANVPELISNFAKG